MKSLAACLLALTLVAAWSSTAGAEPTLKALLIDGQNNHNWPATTPLLKKALEDSGQFSFVEVATTPPSGQDLSGFKPDFAAYDVVVSNYNGEPWPEETQKALVEYVRGGGGLAVVHAANNAFPQWPEYNDMIGLGWRGAEFGDRITYDEQGQIVRVPKGEGPGAGHGAQHAFAIEIRNAEHPITKGMPAAWRPRPEHGDPGLGLCREGHGGHRRARADDLGRPLRRGARIHHGHGP
jgi:hypothetical protein